MKQKIVGLIPVREGSQRVKGKNFIDFTDGKSLLDIKIGHLKNAGCFDRIYISSDSKKAMAIAKKNNVGFLKRASDMCNSTTPWAEVVSHIMKTIPGDPVVVWALTTSPLFGSFGKAVKKFIAVQKRHDSLIAVLPKRSFFLNKHGKGINYNPGHWHPYSQELETYYEVTGACYIGKKSDMLKWSYWFGPKPYLHEVSEIESIDVDTQGDFELAKKLYEASANA